MHSNLRLEMIRRPSWRAISRLSCPAREEREFSSPQLAWRFPDRPRLAQTLSMLLVGEALHSLNLQRFLVPERVDPPIHSVCHLKRESKEANGHRRTHWNFRWVTSN